MRKTDLFALFCAITLGAAGCAGRHIVSAAPPSVSTLPPDVTGPMPQPETPPPTVTLTEPPPEATPTAPPLPPVKRSAPPRPRPSPAETAESAPSKPEAPQISPQLSAGDLAMAKNHTTSNITTAEQNLQQVRGRQMSPAQKDLAQKVSGFLGQAHEAILADDWVRAMNLAEKARLLSTELVKSF